MPTLQEKLENIIEQELKDGKADLETLENGHVCGHVISSEFEGQDYEQRRMRIREILDDSVQHDVVAADELTQVSTLLTYTPAEWSVAIADS